MFRVDRRRAEGRSHSLIVRECDTAQISSATTTLERRRIVSPASVSPAPGLTHPQSALRVLRFERGDALVQLRQDRRPLDRAQQGRIGQSPDHVEAVPDHRAGAPLACGREGDPTGKGEGGYLDDIVRGSLSTRPPLLNG